MQMQMNIDFIHGLVIL